MQPDTLKEEDIPAGLAMVECKICFKTFKQYVDPARGEVPLFICQDCEPLLPPDLVKAFFDPFFYAVGLSTGEVVVFHEADIRGRWVHLLGVETLYGERPLDHEDVPHEKRLPFSFPRGVWVRLDNIVWCADAPLGS